MNRNIDVASARAFLAVVDAGTVTIAARQLHLTQGAVSQQLQRLQSLSDRRLFVRAGRGLSLTEEGHRLVPVAKQFLAANDAMLSALKAPQVTGEVKFGAPYDIMGSYAPPILSGFSAAFPGIRVTLICEDTVLLLDGVSSGRIDLALTTEDGCGKTGEPLSSDRLVWAGARGGLAHTKDPLPVSLGADTCVFRPAAITALKKARIDWQAVCEISNMEPVRATLEADIAVAPLLRHSVPESLDILEGDSRLPDMPMFNINLYTNRAPNRTTQEFAARVRRSVAAG